MQNTVKNSNGQKQIHKDTGEPLWKRTDVAKRFQVHKETVRRWEARGLLKAIKINARLTRYEDQEVERFEAEARV